MAELAQSRVAIYAELLSNIKQVSVVVSLPSVADAATTATVINNGATIKVHHQGRVQSLDLPAQVAMSAALPIPQASTTLLNWRFPLSPQASSPATPFSLEDQPIPWEAKDIVPGSHVCCRKCANTVINEGSIASWKDLPSENWAEMMEFWHCHKPADHKHDEQEPVSQNGQHQQDEALTRRGYGASNAISAQPGVGFVDSVSFMVSESDCKGLLFSASSGESKVPQSRLALGETHPLKFIPISCQSCRTEIGVYNVLAAFVTLFKWQISCKTTITSPNIPPSSLQCLAATLTSNISRYASTKSVIVPHGLPSRDEIGRGPDSSLHLWVLNPRLIYTSSEVDGRREAMKVLYREIDYEEGIKMIETVSSEVQEVSTSASMIESVRSGLQRSTETLPDDARRFKDWRVGLLDRWC